MAARRPEYAARRQGLNILGNRAARNSGEPGAQAPDFARYVTATAGPLHGNGGAAIYHRKSKEAHINKNSNHIVVPAVVASNLKRIADAVSAAPDIDGGRVRAARDALARGEYEINTERIAEKLIEIDTVSRHNGSFRYG